MTDNCIFNFQLYSLDGEKMPLIQFRCECHSFPWYVLQH